MKGNSLLSPISHFTRWHYTLVAPVVLALSLGAAPLALASHVGEEPDLIGDTEVVGSTDQMLRALKDFERTSPAQARSARKQTLVQLAELRRNRMLQLLQRNPKLAALRLFPAKLRERLPPEARALIEQDVQISGEVQARVIDDLENGHSHTHFYLQSSAGELELHLADPDGGERDLFDWSGRKVSMTAARLNGHLLVRLKRDVQVQAANGASAAATSVTAAAALVSGQQRALIMLLNFTDLSVACPADLTTRLFGATGTTANVGYLQSSRNQVGFSGQVVGPFTIAFSSTDTTCNTNAWATAADAAATAAGIDLTQFNRHTYVLPSGGGGCNWSGLGQMPGRRSWIRSCGSTGVFSHEWGHNLSFHHASTPTSEYGDNSDPMGGARVVQSNGANRVMAGWLSETDVLEVRSGGSYSINAVELPSSGSPQVLRIFKPDTNEWYYISLRQALDLDSTLGTTFLNRLSVHRATGRLPTRTYLMATLAVGQSYTDAANGITVTHQSLAANTSTVAVAYGGAVCVPGAPAVSVTPSSASAAPGGTATYTVAVTNRNSVACGPSTFALSQTLPTGFAGVLANTSLTLATGVTASTTWRATAGASLADGTYTLGVNAVESAAGSTSTTANASFIVFTPPPPTLTVTRPAQNAVLSGSSTTLSATASDPAGIQSVEFYVDEVLKKRDTTSPYSVSWTLTGVVKGPHVVRVRATSRAGGIAETVVNVTIN